MSTLDYLRAVYGDSEGRAHIGVGTGPRLVDGKLKHEGWTQTHYAWPAEADQLVRALAQESAAGADAYVCPYLMHGTKRAKGAAVGRRLVHADVDGTLDPGAVEVLRGFAVTSGSEGHGHVYVPLDRPVSGVVHTALCRALGTFLGDADAKVTDNDLLRPPGTLNHKTDPPRPVEWLRPPTGHLWTPDDLATALGVTLPHPEAQTAPSAASVVVERVEVDRIPQRVREALANVTGDRSADTMRVVGACHDAGLTLAQTRGVVMARGDLAQRLAERTDDDVLTCWLKATDSRAQRRQADDWTAELSTVVDSDSAEVDAEPAEEDRAARARRLFPRLDWHALWADDSEEEWIHHPLLPARRSVVIYSPPKVGKSLFVLELAVAVSRGEAFLDHKVDRRYRVLYVDFENDPRGDVRGRLQAMGYGPDDLDHLDYLSFPTMAGLDTERGALELLEAVKAYGSELVVIDTVSRAVDGEENSNDTWLGLYRRTGLKLKQAGVAMLRLDHTGKDESKGQRGGSAKSGDVDMIWRLSRITDTRLRLECTDARLRVSTKSLQLTRETYPRLRHTVQVLGAMTAREARVAHLVRLCDENGLPADTGRDGIRLFCKGRGEGGRNDLFAEVARVRKAAAGPVPDLGDSDPGGDRSQTVPEARDSTPPTPDLTSDNTCPQVSGTGGDSTHRPPPVPVPRSIERDSGTAGQNEDRQVLIGGTNLCADCGVPYDQPGLISRCRDRHDRSEVRSA